MNMTMETPRMKPFRIFPVLLAFVLFAPLSALAENSTSAGGFTVHYNAFTTSTLTPEVAKVYGIQRSNRRGMLNVSIIKEKEGATGASVKGRVAVKMVALTGQSTALPMREIKDQKAVYYIGEFPVQSEEKINFVIEATPEGSDETFVVRMEQQFFGN
jgi:hypothetical protein